MTQLNMLSQLLGPSFSGKIQLWDFESRRWSFGPKLLNSFYYAHIATSGISQLILFGVPGSQNSVLTCMSSKHDCQWNLGVNPLPHIDTTDQSSAVALKVSGDFVPCKGPEVLNAINLGNISVHFAFQKVSQDDGIGICLSKVFIILIKYLW